MVDVLDRVIVLVRFGVRFQQRFEGLFVGWETQLRHEIEPTRLIHRGPPEEESTRSYRIPASMRLTVAVSPAVYATSPQRSDSNRSKRPTKGNILASTRPCSIQFFS